MLSIIQIYIEGFTLHFFFHLHGYGEPLVIPGMLQNPLCAVFYDLNGLFVAGNWRWKKLKPPFDLS